MFMHRVEEKNFLQPYACQPMERGWKSHVEISPTCPRCGSSNTKFCYYNNYSLTQPRYFCKGCRRYWTKGGSLRNVPVGGGCRKSRRGKPFRNVVSIPSKDVSGGGLDVVALGCSAMTTATLAPSINGSSARTDQVSNIDLALVYANFLNQKPRTSEAVEAEKYSPHHPQIEIPMPPNAVVAGDPSFRQFPTPLLSQENMFVDQCRPFSYLSSETHFTNAFFLAGFDSIEKQTDHHHHHHLNCGMETQTNNYGLPPLPGEELNTVVSEGVFWSGSNDLIFPSQTLHATELSRIQEPQHATNAEAQEQKLLGTENISQFNMPIEFCDFFRP